MSSGKKSDILKGIKILKEVLPPDSPSAPRTIYGREFQLKKFPEDSEIIQKLAHYVDCIDHGILPDGDVLAFIADSINIYLQGQARNLDIAFGLDVEKEGISSENDDQNQNIKKIYRNPATKYSREVTQLEEYIDIQLFQNHKNISQPEAAEKMLSFHGYNQDDIDVNPESILRNYRRNIKDKKLFEQQVKHLSRIIPPNSDT